jgi:hypothetical protein
MGAWARSHWGSFFGLLIEVEHQMLFFCRSGRTFFVAWERPPSRSKPKRLVVTTNQQMRLVDGKPGVSHLQR